MKPLSEYIDQPLRLKRKSLFSREFDLFAAEELLGSFRYKRLFHVLGIVKGFGLPTIEFFKEHFWNIEIEIREEEKEIPFAKYKRDPFRRSGTVELPSGEKLFIHFGYFNQMTEIKDSSEKIIATLKRPAPLSRGLEVTVKEKSVLLDKNPWVIFLAHYLVLRRRQRRR